MYLGHQDLYFFPQQVHFHISLMFFLLNLPAGCDVMAHICNSNTQRAETEDHKFKANLIKKKN